jgi:hypothetical protein
MAELKAKYRKHSKRALVSVAILAALIAALCIMTTITFASPDDGNQGRWITGDFHTHTYLTDGNFTFPQVTEKSFKTFGLGWLANSEHGGFSARQPNGTAFTSPVPRWITLSLYSYPLVMEARADYPQKMVVQGVEWNVPAGEHASVGIVAKEPAAVANFEYMFDKSDTDTSRAVEGLVKNNTTHASANAGATWLQTNFKDSSYFLLNHPSRQQKYTVADIRDFNNAAPDVAFGFEGLPGHQKEAGRGGYGGSSPAVTPDPKVTYGGADIMVAQVGGLWDALLGEGRRFWTFTNSDFHDTPGDFWPGEYSKSYYRVQKYGDYKSLVSAMRSGNSFAVLGDLIDGLDFTASQGSKKATMGQELVVKNGSQPTITIRFHSPNTNNNGDHPKVDHVDLIAGQVTSPAASGTPAYDVATNSTTAVIATFDQSTWKKADKEGWYTVTFRPQSGLNSSMYYRLRGTNLDQSVASQTDAAGNPLSDALMGPNSAAAAYADLWFYSNPIFVTVTP